MAKPLIHIFGASGSGTSTLGRFCAETLGYRFMDTDDYFWLPTNPPYTTSRDREKRLQLIRSDYDKSSGAVLSGSLVGWGDPLIALFTLAVRMITPTDVRMERLHIRESDKFGARIEPGGDMYKDHLEFMAWAERYDTAGFEQRSKVEHDEWEKGLPCPVIHVDGTMPCDEIFVEIKKALW